VFDNEYRVILLFHATNFTLLRAKQLRNVIKRALARRGVNDYFYGLTFGKFEFVIEFTSKSTITASETIGLLRSRLKRSLADSEVKVCISVVYGVTAYPINCSCPRFEYDALQAYVFVIPVDDDVDSLASSVENLDRSSSGETKTRLLWTHGIQRVLEITGPCFEGIMQKLNSFRISMSQKYKSTSTCIAIDYRNERRDGCSLITGTHNQPIHSITYVCRRLTGRLDLPDDPDFLECFGKHEGFENKQISRLGGYDTLFALRKKSLRDIFSTLDDVRRANSDKIGYTSTVLLYKDEQK